MYFIYILQTCEMWEFYFHMKRLHLPASTSFSFWHIFIMYHLFRLLELLLLLLLFARLVWSNNVLRFILKTFNCKMIMTDSHFDCSLGSLRPKPRASPWYYQFIGRFKSLTTRSLGRFVGRMKGRNKVFKCARRARNMGHKAFALRNRGDCYVSRYSKTYSGKVRMYGRFKASSGGLRSIDAYKIGEGKNFI